MTPNDSDIGDMYPAMLVYNSIIGQLPRLEYNIIRLMMMMLIRTQNGAMITEPQVGHNGDGRNGTHDNSLNEKRGGASRRYL